MLEKEKRERTDRWNKSDRRKIEEKKLKTPQQQQRCLIEKEKRTPS